MSVPWLSEMIPSVIETVGRDFAARLHRVAVGFVLPVGPNVRDAVVLAEDLLASAFSGSATLEVAALERGAILSDAEQPIREMLAEHGIHVPILESEEAHYQLLLSAFGLWDLPLHFFETPFYGHIPAWDDQAPLDRTLVTLLDRRDHENTAEARRAIEDEMRAAARAHVLQV